MAKALVYGSMDPCSILAPFIDFLFFFLILWKFSKLEAGFGYITPLVLNFARFSGKGRHELHHPRKNYNNMWAGCIKVDYILEVSIVKH